MVKKSEVLFHYYYYIIISNSGHLKPKLKVNKRNGR